jgi:hypothetical protein
MLVLPEATPVASPVAEIVATPTLLDAQVATPVKSCWVPSAYVPVAVYCWVPATESVAAKGAIAIEVRTADVTVAIVWVEPS